MPPRDEYPAGVPCWIDTGQPDPDAAMLFYGGLFGWQFERVTSSDSPGPYFLAHLDGLAVAGVWPLPDEMGPEALWASYVCVESADLAAARASEAGGSVVTDPFDVGDAGRIAVLADQAGAVFCVLEPRSLKGAESVNAHGTWNWSELNTSDTEQAKAFYGTVFGWEATAVEMAGDEGIMWRLPGYGDFLEQLAPGTLERHKDFGAPEGFSDAIAWLSELAPDDVRPPHWSVTFASDDVRTHAEKAVELGGAVIVEPFDAEVVRVAVLADPQGAKFAVNQFEPDGL
jgi:predicted enzyme related to lactoylglutathione lyase